MTASSRRGCARSVVFLLPVGLSGEAVAAPKHHVLYQLGVIQPHRHQQGLQERTLQGRGGRNRRQQSKKQRMRQQHARLTARRAGSGATASSIDMQAPVPWPASSPCNGARHSLLKLSQASGKAHPAQRFERGSRGHILSQIGGVKHQALIHAAVVRRGEEHIRPSKRFSLIQRWQRFDGHRTGAAVCCVVSTGLAGPRTPAEGAGSAGSHSAGIPKCWLATRTGARASPLRHLLL